jgi:hypothetical protein
MLQLTELSLLAESVKASWNTYFGKVHFFNRGRMGPSGDWSALFYKRRWHKMESGRQRQKSQRYVLSLDNGSGFAVSKAGLYRLSSPSNNESC